MRKGNVWPKVYRVFFFLLWSENVWIMNFNLWLSFTFLKIDIVLKVITLCLIVRAGVLIVIDMDANAISKFER